MFPGPDSKQQGQFLVIILHPWLPLLVSFFVFYVFVLLQGDISISSTRADVSLVSTGAKSEASFGSRTSKSSRKSVHHIQGQFYGAKLSAGAAVGFFLQIKGWFWFDIFLGWSRVSFPGWVDLCHCPWKYYKWWTSWLISFLAFVLVFIF